MSGKFIKLSVGGEYSLVDPQPDEEGSTLKQMQEAVGGWIEHVQYRRDGMVDIWINEEGKLRGLDINPIATALSSVFGYDVLVGDALITRTDENGDTVPLTPADIERLTAEIRWLGGREAA